MGYGHITQEILDKKQPVFNRRDDNFYKANVVVLVAVRSPQDYTCIVMPTKQAETAAQLHLDAGYRKGKKDGQPRKPGPTAIFLDNNPRARKETNEKFQAERKLLDRYRNEEGWDRLKTIKAMLVTTP